MAPRQYYIEPVQPVLRRFVEDVHNIVAREHGSATLLEALRKPTEQLLYDPSWIGDEFRRVLDEVASWAVYRSQDPDLCIFTMVVPPSAATRVHNHLTDGWVGLVQGGQIERQFRRVDDRSQPGVARLELASEEAIGLGEVTSLAYPDHDIHQIFTTSAEASVSLHVLCNDLGAVRRQTFDPDAGTVQDFVSGYSNVEGGAGIGAPG
jgi:predicted metal-dependent enzyme (double-stranded beta helix superfamily)